jgi:hypothetical protein
VRDKAAKDERALRVVKADEQDGAKRRPLRSACLPDAPGEEKALFDFALERDGNKPRHHQVVVDVERLLDTDAYDTVMKPALDIAEARRVSPLPGEKAKRNSPGPYTVHELWLIEAAHRALGHLTYHEHHEWLVSDYALRFRRRFDFNRERNNRAGGRAPVMTQGIPSKGTLSRYRNDWFPEVERRDAWMRFERALQYEIAEVDPEGVRREGEALLADGSVKETHHAVPIYRKLKPGQKRKPGERPINEFRKDRVTGEPMRDKRTGELVSGITCPEGGHIAGGSDHAGSGFNFVAVMDQGANIPSWRVVALNEPENASLYEQRAEVDAYLRRVGVEMSVLTTDKAFHSTPEKGMPRGGWHDIRVIENIHLSSHGDSDTNLKSAAARRKQKLVIDWNDKFWLDGHRQGHCTHGKAKVVRRVDERKRGSGITIRTEYVCPSTDKADHCGSVTLTAGMYRLSDNGAKVVKARRDEQARVDWTIGNFLTFDDAEYAKKFGLLRRSLQEGFFGSQLTNRLGALEKRWIRRKAQAELDIAISLSILHAGKLAHRRARLGKPRAGHGAATAMAA